MGCRSLKESIQKKHDIKITFTDMILKAAALALRENIEVNSSLKDNEYIIYDSVNVGMAVAVEEGLIVPTLFSCDNLDIVDIARKRIELIEKAKNGKLSLEEIQNGTFTVTNLGMFGIRSFSAIKRISSFGCSPFSKALQWKVISVFHSVNTFSISALKAVNSAWW